MSTETQDELRNPEAHPLDPSAVNPSADDYNDKFNSSNRDVDTSRKTAQEGEKKAIGATAAGKALETAAASTGNVFVRGAAMIVARLNTKSGRTAGILVSLLLFVLVGLGIITPSAILIRLKEEGTSWMSKYTNIGVNNRMQQVLKARWFSDPTKCTGMCRFYPGMTADEVTSLRNISGVNIDDADIGTSGTKRFIKKMTFTEGSTVHTISASNFQEFHSKNIAFRAAINPVINAKSLTFRSTGALKKFSAFAWDRAKPLGEIFSQSSILKFFREKFYGKKGALSLTPKIEDDPNASAADKAKAAGLADLEAQLGVTADSLRPADILENGPTALVPDVTALTPENAAKSVATIGVSGVKGAVLGFFNTVSSGCEVYNVFRIMNFGVKALAAYQLIKYAGLFATIADKQKADEVNVAEVAFLASILLKPSTMPASKGKDFSRSQGASLIFDHKISHPDDLQRFSLGNIASQALSKFVSVFSFNGTTPKVCQNVMSWWGQGLLAIGGIISSFLTLGAGAATGIAEGIAKGIALSYIQQVMTPRLIPIIAGTLVPDFLDPEGGYGAGNAIAAGFGAFGGQLGRTKGMRPLKKAEFAILSNSQEAQTLVAAENLNYQQMGIYSLDNPTSIPNTLAYNLTSLTQPKSSLGEYVSSVGSVVASAFTTPFSNAASAAVSDEYQGQYCADGQISQIFGSTDDYARDANCNIIFGPDITSMVGSSLNPVSSQVASTTSSGVLASVDIKYSLDNTVKYMLDHQQIDASGEAVGSEYKAYVENCAEGSEPFLDGYAADLSSGVDLSICTSTNEDAIYYRTYRGFDEAETGISAAAESTLGTSTAETGANTGLSDPTSATITADAKSLAQQILDLEKAGKITIGDFSENKASDSASRSLASQQLADIAAGKAVGITDRCKFTVPSPIIPDPKLLQFLVDYGNQFHYTINTLFGQCHTSAGSNHYKGKAVDFGCPGETSLADSIGSKYDVSRNPESCSVSPRHWHYSVGGN